MSATRAVGARRVATRTRKLSWEGISRLRRLRRAQNIATFGLVVLGPILALVTYLVMGPLDQGTASNLLRIVLLADLIYVIIVAALVLQRVVQMITARRKHSAGSRLHLRLTGVFAIMALAPTITVAIFATFTVNMGLEAWFSDRVGRVVDNSVAAAQAYEDEHRRDLVADARVLASVINATKRAAVFIDDGDIRQVLSRGQREIQRGLREAYVIDGTGEIRARGERSYLFDYEEPSAADLEQARTDGVLIIRDWDNNEFRVLMPLEAITDRYLYVSRNVDGDILNLLDDTQETARFYAQRESERDRVLFEFGLLYLGFAVILILAAVWLGMWFAERLSRPVGRLTSAAQRVGSGDLDVRVLEEEGDDEIAMLGTYFNQMTHQLKGQRERLLSNTQQIERRRRLFDSVLGSVSSGVVGMDAKGRITFVNRAAERLLDWHEDQQSLNVKVAVPEFSDLFERLKRTASGFVQEEIKVTRSARQENLLVRMSTRSGEDGKREGYVVAFDDVTDLVSAQRMAAWGDVARRIAHEIKNPLTPIQLSAERIKRKFGRQLDEGPAAELEQLTDVVVRQTNDLRRIVDEFSKFARMPEPETKQESLSQLVREAVVLQKAGQPDVRFETTFTDDNMDADVDATMINQALTNLIKNAGEAIESLLEKGKRPEGHEPQVKISTSVEDGEAVIRIADNGIGLPQDRSRLFEPYVTTRDKGTGLGLPIVKKIIEEHSGSLTLEDAPAFEEGAHQGAMAVIKLPLLAADLEQQNIVKQAVEGSMGDILIVDDERDIRELIADILEDEGYSTRRAGNSDDCMAAIAEERPALLILDIWLKDSQMDGIDILKAVKRDYPEVPVVIISGHGNVEIAVAAIKQGAYDFIEKPFNIDQLLVVIRRGMETAHLRRENIALKRKDVEPAEILGESSTLKTLLSKLDKVTKSNGRVMLSGPAGAGKELAARYIHANSNRASGPFVVVGCASIEPERMEEVLFGRENGERGIEPGLLDEANGGVIYFDEVADMPMGTQSKILRVLVDQTFIRVGGSDKVKVDLRVISSTNHDLEAEIAADRFRRELYHRLNVVPVSVPALEERREDIPLLVEHFIDMFHKSQGLPARSLSDEASALLQTMSWPGNVRQLRNVIERVLILGDGTGPILTGELPGESEPASAEEGRVVLSGAVATMPLREAREAFEREYLLTQINRFGGNVSRTAEFVGMERSALHRKLKSLGVVTGSKAGGRGAHLEAEDVD